MIARRPSPVLPPALALAVLLFASLAPGVPASPAAPKRPHQSPGPSSAPEILLSSDPAVDGVPDVAHDPDRDRYLAVWISGTTLQAQLLDRAGVPIGEPTDVAVVRDRAALPRVAYTPSMGRYLVVWADEADHGHDVYGRLLDADGRLVRDAFAVYEGAGDQSAPSLAAVAGGADYLVVWSGHLQDDSVDVAGRMISSSGHVSPEVSSIAAAGGLPYADVDVAYHPENHGFLVTYLRDEDAGHTVLGRRVLDTPGATAGPEFTIARVASGTAARVTALPGPWWLVWWAEVRGGNLDVVGRQVSVATGTPPGAEVTIADGPDHQSEARVATTASGQTLVVWEQERNQPGAEADLLIASLAPDGRTRGPAEDLVSGAGEQVAAAMALGVGGVVLWCDRQGLGPADVYAIPIDEAGSPLWIPSNLSAARGSQTAPAIAAGAGGILAVWQSARAGDGGTDIVARRLAPNGKPVEDPWVLDGDGHANVEPAVAYSPAASTYVVVWADQTDGRLEARRVPTEGTTVLLDPVPDSAGGRRPRLAYDPDDRHFLLVWDAHGDVYGRVHLGVQTVPPPPSVAVAEGVGTQDQPAVAFQPGRGRFLVVWRGGTSGAEDVYGRLLSVVGAPIADPFLVAGGGADSVARGRPDVTAGGAGFAVAYVAAVAAKQGQVRLRWVTGEGSVGGDEIAALVVPASRDQSDARVLFDARRGLFEVVWAEMLPDTGWDLVGRRLSPDGSLGAFTPLYRGPGDQRFPGALTADDGDLFVAWEDARRGKVTDIYGRRGRADVMPRVTPTATPTPTDGPTATRTPWITRTATATPTDGPTPTRTPWGTRTVTATPTDGPTPTRTPWRPRTATATTGASPSATWHLATLTPTPATGTHEVPPTRTSTPATGTAEVPPTAPPGAGTRVWLPWARPGR